MRSICVISVLIFIGIRGPLALTPALTTTPHGARIMRLDHLSIDDLQSRCQEAEEAFRQKNPSRDAAPCLELLRRAVMTGDDDAWTAFIAIYQGQVARWVQGDAPYHTPMWSQEELVWVVFGKFATTMTPKRYQKRMPWTLAQVMAYLRRIATNVRLAIAKQESRRRQHLSLDDLANLIPDPMDETPRILLWEDIRMTLESDKERLVAREKFVDGNPPREIFARHPDSFADTQEIYAILHAIRKRVQKRLQD